MGDDYFTGSNLIPPVNTILVAASVVIPVSYTHLDVYKRQAQVCFHEGGQRTV